MATPRQRRRNRPPQVESLEAMTLLSALPLSAAALAPAAQRAAATTTSNQAFNATVSGTFVASKSNPDLPADYHIVAFGKTTRGTPVSVGTDIFTPGFINQGRAHGTLTVFTAKGSLTLDVTGPVQPGFSPLPTKLGFTITGGTGVYANQHTGSGTIAVSYHVTHTGTGHSIRDFTQSGPITMVFRSGSPIV